mmetsp:Transcript_31529/g.74209  ORF Transcript_31529/g.74209 Transcript_31529/m.74209 type:complete len:288 (-) Transcript_31529:964-1827(-)
MAVRTNTYPSSFFAVIVVLFSFGVTESFVTHSHRPSLRQQLLPVTSLSLSDYQCRTNTIIDDGKVSNADNESGARNDTSGNNFTRRRASRLLFQSVTLGSFSWDSLRQVAIADESPDTLEPETKETQFISGTVILPTGMNAPGEVETSNNNDAIDRPETKPALYITARPNRPDNVPRAILDGSRGKPPPVLAARYESPGFPFTFQLSEKDLTPEGENTSGGSGNNKFWWSADDLVVSARWDSDGVAATRSPEDLVGRNLWKRDDSSAQFVLPLQGRGSFGKFATKKS